MDATTAPTPRTPRLLARFSSVLIPVAAALVALLFGAILIALLGENPLKGFGSMLSGSFGSRTAIGRTVVRAIPLMLVGAGISIAFRASVINIGGEGQIVAGGLLATTAAVALPNSLPAAVMIPATMLAGMLGGFLYGAIPGLLKAHFNVNEILSTIMLNIVAAQFMNWILAGALRNPNQEATTGNIPETRRMPISTDLPQLPGGFHVHSGLIVAIIAAGVAWVLLWRTTMGFRLRAVGFSQDAAKYSGMGVRQNVTLALAISGAFCGLAGAVLVFGSESHTMSAEVGMAGFTGSAGFNGIIAALFGGLNPLYVLPSSILFGALMVGANQMQRDIQIPAALGLAMNGIIVIFMVSSTSLRAKLARWSQRGITQPPDEVSPSASTTDPEAVTA